MPIIFLEFSTDWDNVYFTSTLDDVLEPSRIKTEKQNIFIRLKWLMMVLVWKFKHRKWNKCRQKTKALDKYKYKLMKGYNI